MALGVADGGRHPRMDDWAGLGHRCAGWMVYWLVGDLEKLGCFDPHASDHAPDFKVKQHLNSSPVPSHFELAEVVSGNKKRPAIRFQHKSVDSYMGKVWRSQIDGRRLPHTALPIAWAILAHSQGSEENWPSTKSRGPRSAK